jgi:hypothetical protein
MEINILGLNVFKTEIKDYNLLNLQCFSSQKERKSLQQVA